MYTCLLPLELTGHPGHQNAVLQLCYLDKHERNALYAESGILGLCLYPTDQLRDLRQVTYSLQAPVFSSVKPREQSKPYLTKVVWLKLGSKCESSYKFLGCTNIKCYYDINKTYLVMGKKEINLSQFLQSPDRELPQANRTRNTALPL